ncbi:hypothetical protein BH10BAC3_BH10BAC3_41700 [soil metagenome]
MEQEQLRFEYQRLSLPKSLKDAQEMLDIFCRFFLKIMHNHHRTPYKNEQENECRIIAQMLLSKTHSIKKLTEGVEFDEKEGVRLNNVMDPTPISCLVRNIYETVCMFNLIFLNTPLGDEKKIVYNLWCIAGLKYRERFHSVITKKENTIKQQDEAKKISELTNEIHDTLLYQSMDDKNKKKIDDKIKGKDFLITFIGSEVIYQNWQSLSSILGLKEIVRNNIYTYFSLYSHPSYVSVFQFRDMFETSENSEGLAIFNLQYLFFLLGAFIADYLITFPEAVVIFNEIRLIDQIMINTYNSFARGLEYSINDSWKALG